MALIRFKNQSPITDTMGSIFEDFFGERLTGMPTRFRNGYTQPAANIRENEKDFEIELAAPGKKKSDFNIEINEDLLTISSEHTSENKTEDEGYAVKEYDYEGFTRSFRLPEIVDAENIKAAYTDGILKLNVPKKEQEVKKVRRISVN